MFREHNPNIWMADLRLILAASLSDEREPLLASDGFTFERFERSGEMASIPFLRAVNARGVAIEAPVRNWAWIEFSDQLAPADAQDDEEIPF